MYKTLTIYNDRNNSPLLNEKIREAIHKVMEEESMSDANNVSAETFIHMPNAQRCNSNALFIIKKLYKPDKLVDTLKYLTINNDEYYASNSKTASDAQGDITRDTNTVTYTRNGKEKVTDTSNGSFE